MSKTTYCPDCGKPVVIFWNRTMCFDCEKTVVPVEKPVNNTSHESEAKQ